MKALSILFLTVLIFIAAVILYIDNLFAYQAFISPQISVTIYSVCMNEAMAGGEYNQDKMNQCQKMEAEAVTRVSELVEIAINANKWQERQHAFQVCIQNATYMKLVKYTVLEPCAEKALKLKSLNQIYDDTSSDTEEF